MKKMMVRIFLAVLLLVACGTTPVLADGTSPVPYCFPKACPN